jgi:hypothetical protein
MDAVVDGEAVAEILEHRAARRAGNEAEAGDDEALVEDLHVDDLLLERLCLDLHFRELVEVGIGLSAPAGGVHELQPRLGVARLVLHHRRVVELRLVIGRHAKELRRHLDRELVGLELLRDDGAPHVPPAGELLGAALVLRDRRSVVPREFAHLPLGALGQLVVTEDPLVG